MKMGPWLVAVSAGSLLTAGCGTRLSDDDFLAVQQGIGPTSAPDGTAAGSGAGATPLPGASASAGPGGTTGGTTSGGTQPGTTGGTPGGITGGTQPGGPKAQNYASDVGVTATTITVGNIRTQGGVFGPDQFTPSFYGAAAYFQDLNAQGGVNGRSVIFRSCDDGGDTSGNQACACQLVEQDKIFALAANNIFNYGADSYVSGKGVPDIGGQPIGVSYDTYPHLYSIYGSQYPRDGKVGYKGKLYGGTEDYRFYKQKFGLKRAGVVYYDQAQSARFGQGIAKFLRAEGFDPVVEYRVSLALANFDQVVVDMRDKKIEGVWDAMDAAGNANLCQAMNSNNFVPKVKASTISTWTESVGRQFDPPCRDAIYVIGKSRPYTETGHPEVAKFRTAMRRYFPQRESKLHQWSLEGWAAAMWLTDAIASCGAAVTRVCVEKFMNRGKAHPYTARGLLAPRFFEPYDFSKVKTAYECDSAVHWKVDHWETVGIIDKDCFATPYQSYSPQ